MYSDMYSMYCDVHQLLRAIIKDMCYTESVWRIDISILEQNSTYCMAFPCIAFAFDVT